MEIQLELHLPDPDQRELDLQPQREEGKQKPLQVCIGNCNICRQCGNSNNREKEVIL